MDNWTDRLRDKFADTGWTMAELSRRSGVGYDSLNKYMRGDVDNPRGPALAKLAKALDVSVEWLKVGDGGVMTLPVVGYIGGGAEFHAIDDNAKGGGIDTITAPPGCADDSVAVQIRGDSMMPVYNDGDILVYSDRRYDAESFFNKRCIVGLADGRILVKTLTRGSQDGLFTLISFNAAPIIDVVIEWVGKIEWVQPR